MKTYSDLAKSSVLFDERTHSYTTPDGVELSGVTSIINSTLFSDKYAGIPSYILEKAAKRGSDIHAACQLYDIMNQDNPIPELASYKKIKEEHSINMIASEYLVSDDMTIATMIDCIDSNLNLYDIKTTSKLDEDYLSWQLSFCAYLFENQNPSLQVGKLYGIWLRGHEYKLVEVKRRTKEEVQEIINAYIKGEKLAKTSPYVNGDMDIANIVNIEHEIIQFKRAIDALEAQKKKSLSILKERMEESGTKKIQTDRVMITLVPDSTSNAFDSTLFKKEHPDIASQYMKPSTRKGYVKITLRE